jgi:hypothetical protein
METINFDEIVTYSITDAGIAKLKADYLPLVVRSVMDMVGYDACRKARIEVKGLRVDIEKRRKELKAESLEFGRRVDAKAKALMEPLTAIESHLQSQQDIVDNEKKRLVQEEERRAEAQFQERVSKLQECGAYFNLTDIKLMTEEEYTLKLLEEQERFARRQEKEAIEKARLAELEAIRVEQQRKIDEQEADAKRLRDELIAKQRAELAEKERQLNEAKEAERKAQAEKVEAERQIERQRLAALAEQERIQEEATQKRLKEEYAVRMQKEAAEAEARRKADDEKLFDTVKTKFPTIESCWGEIVRLTKLQK